MPVHSPNITAYIVTGEDEAKRIAAALIDRSASFIMDPYPYDQWLFGVKREQESFMESMGAVILPGERG
jgi:hypothetical protein